MAKQVESIIVGIDVSKAELEVFRSDTGENLSISNDQKTIKRLLDSLSQNARIAIEPTGSYHLPLLGEALQREIPIYLISGEQLNYYRGAVGNRAKTDAADAQLLARFLEREGKDLRPVKPRTAEEKRMWQLLRRRACVVQARTAMMQSLKELGGSDRESKRMLDAVQRFIDLIERRAIELARSLGWQEDLARAQSVPGVGKLSALAMVLIFRQGPFNKADAFIAFMGLDVRVRDSGKKVGQRRLTKKGDPEVRRLLFLAGRNARIHTERFRSYFERLTARGIHSIAADMAVGRKLARIVFSLLKNQRTYEPDLA